MLDIVQECQEIPTGMCKRTVDYNVTGMPNFAGHDIIQDAELQLQTYAPLIQYGCSSKLKQFLCFVYFPKCDESVHDNIGPCRSLCLDVQKLCRPILNTFGFPWPGVLECTKFPLSNDQERNCMKGPVVQEEYSVDLDRGMIRRFPKPNLTTPRTTTSTQLAQSRRHYGGNIFNLLLNVLFRTIKRIIQDMKAKGL
ncbi:FZD4 [Mytilus coruscus]|uniref:FZD4 n=1 Tax=Mytilus coruscus TaxID=42192 RepID=A0A6J8BQ87_MYTCO|nr:FZD4 [Mytilus coruscus]